MSMKPDQSTDAASEPSRTVAPPNQPAPDLNGEMLIEEISIDGMCGVY